MSSVGRVLAVVFLELYLDNFIIAWKGLPLPVAPLL